MATRGPRNRNPKFQKKRSQNAYWQWAFAHARTVQHGDRMQGEFEFDMRSATAHGTLIAQNTKSFSGPKWPLPSILFAKHIKIT